MAAFVLDKKGRPLMPCSEKRARQLLERRRARVHKLTPFAIRLVDRLVENRRYASNSIPAAGQQAWPSSVRALARRVTAISTSSPRDLEIACRWRYGDASESGWRT